MNIGYDKGENWSHINEFLQRERDSIFSAITHMRLAVAAGIIAAILLTSSSFLGSLSSYLEAGATGSDTSPYSRSNPNTFAIALVVSFGITALLILVFVVAALSNLRKAFIKSLEEDSRNRVQAIKVASEKADVEIPLQTQKLLETFSYESADTKPDKENQSDSASSPEL
ncbi:MAG: hypothetical protein ABW007_15555 [Chitinophagaceae bacterium]